MRCRALWELALLSALVASGGCTLMGKMGQIIMDPSVPVGALDERPTEVAFSLNVSATLNTNPSSFDMLPEQANLLQPSPYAVSLSAEDPHQLAEKLDGLLADLHRQFPSMPDATQVEDDLDAPPRSALKEGTPGSYEAQGVLLQLPNPTPVVAVPSSIPIAIKILQLRDDSLLRNSTYPLLDQDPAKALRSTYVRDDDYLLSAGQFKFVPFEPLHADTRFIAVIANYSHQDNATWQQVLRISPRGRRIVLSVLVEDAQILIREES